MHEFQKNPAETMKAVFTLMKLWKPNILETMGMAFAELPFNDRTELISHILGFAEGQSIIMIGNNKKLMTEAMGDCKQLEKLFRSSIQETPGHIVAHFLKALLIYCKENEGSEAHTLLVQIMTQAFDNFQNGDRSGNLDLSQFNLN